METHAILAEKSVSISAFLHFCISAFLHFCISAFRSNPARYFGDQPIAVLSHNKPADHVVGAELFEEMMKLIGDLEEARSFRSKFRPSAAELADFCKRSTESLEQSTEEQRGTFKEW